MFVFWFPLNHAPIKYKGLVKKNKRIPDTYKVCSRLGKFLGIVCQDTKSSRLHVDIFQFCFNLVEVHSIDSLKWSIIFL